ncbi:MAG: nucleotidyltransferase family protein [Cyclobacteriaceae bacterium]
MPSSAHQYSKDSYREKELVGIVKEHEAVYEVLKAGVALGLSNWYVGAGCLTQSAWNKLHNYPIGQNILDIDFIFYDPDNMSRAYEEEVYEQLIDRLNKTPLDIDVVNQARVHLWYEEQFGIKIEPYTSCENAISTWPTTASSLGVTLIDEKFSVYAPFGLQDLFNLVVRPNKMLIPQKVYEDKVFRWSSNWPKLKVVSWNELDSL